MNKIYLAILILVILASFFRFYNLGQREVISFDEGSFVVEAKTVKYSLDWFSKYLTKMSISDQRARETADLINNFDKNLTNLTTGRPTHNLFMALGQYFYPDPINVGNFVMAFFGVLTVILTFCLTLLVTKSLPVAFLSGLTLSLLPYHIYYSRSSMAETDSQAFFLLSLISYFYFVKFKKLKYYFLMSLAIGVAFTITASRIAFIAPIIADLTLNKREAFKRLPFFVLIFFIPTLLIEALYHFVFLLTHNLNIIFPFPTFFEQLLWSYVRLAPRPSEFSLTNLLSYFVMLIELGGLGFLITTIYGVYAAIQVKKKEYYFLIIVVLITIIFQSLFFLKAARGISPILPVLAIFSGFGVISITNLISKLNKNISRFLVIFLLVVIILGEFILKDLQFFDQKTNMTQMMNYLNSMQIQTIITPSPTLIRAYDPNLKIYNLTYLLDDKLINAYLLTNIQQYTTKNTAFTLSHNLDPTLEYVIKNCPVEYKVTENFSPFTVKMIAFEHNTNMEKTLEFLEAYSYPQDSETKLYKLADCLNHIKKA